MKNFRDNKGGFGGSKRDKPVFQNKSWGVDRGQSYGGDRDKPMYKAVCSECNKNCEVPFRPTGEKPVFCSDCFNKKRDPSDTRGGKREFNDRHSPRPEYSRPADTRPAYKPNNSNDDTKKQFSDISFKLDKLISAIEKMSQPFSAPKPAPVVAPKSEMKKVVVKKVSTKKVTKKKAVSKKK
ncbi:MAG: hypothetical protein KBC11_01365 [Candidatus Pacebacteria bacterium]|nr:hypothetical protein [Candidatus Paceibacterota bacterium]